MRQWGPHCSLSMATALNASMAVPAHKTARTGHNWPRVAALLFNSAGQCGYQYVPTPVANKLHNLVNKKVNHKNLANSYANDNKTSVETVICEMIFGSVALNFCAGNASKIHKLTEELYMNSFVVQIEFSNGRTFQRKYGLALIWDINEFNGQLRQLFLKESVIMDSLVSELKTDLVESRMKSPKDIHRCVLKFLKAINDYLSVCRLTCSISDDQFVDELIALITKYDTKGTHFFVSTLLTSILMFKYKSTKLKLILWSNDVNKLSFISQLLVVINQFLKSNQTKKISFLSPQLKSIKFCRTVRPLETSTSSMTPLTKSIISERKSRDESLGYESLTESGSSTTSTVCDYHGFASKSLDTSTPLERSLDSVVDSSQHRLNADQCDDRTQCPSSSQLNKSRNYLSYYRNVRFTPNQLSDDSTDEDLDSNQSFMFANNYLDNYRLSEELSEHLSLQNSSDSSKCDDFGCDSTDVEEIQESHLLSGFGHISMPQLIVDSSDNSLEISLSQSPTISDTYLSQLYIQGIINSKTITSFDSLMSLCLRQSSNPWMSDNTLIVCDCDQWRVSCVESSRYWPAMMSSSVGNLCESIAELHSLSMNSYLIRKFIDNRINDLLIKSVVLKSLIESQCADSDHKRLLMRLMSDKDSKQSLLTLIADNSHFSELSSSDCLSLGFDVSDIPVIIALNRHSLLSNYNNCKNSDRNDLHLTETVL